MTILKRFYLIFVILVLSRTASAFQYDDEKNYAFQELQSLIEQALKLEEDNTMNPQMSLEISKLVRPLKLQSGICKVCRGVFKSTRYLPQFEIVALLDIIATTVCTVQQTQKFKVCRGAVSQMVPMIIDGAFGKWFDPDIACPHLKLCPKVYEVVDMDKYVHNILVDKPQQTVPIPTYKDTFYMLHISDVHTDLEYKVGAKAECDEPVCCRFENGAPSPGDRLSGRWGTLSNCDLPSETVDSMIKFVSTKANQPIQLGLWTGDNTSHDVWHQTLKRNMENSIDITAKLKQGFPNVKFIPTMGNHESFPVNVYDYNGDREKELQTTLGNIWSSWIGQEAAQQHRDKGFYSTFVQKLGVRVIGLNTQACNDQNWLLMRDPTDPFGQLEWLRNQLIKSEANDQAVYLISHIPSSSCLDEWARVYIALVDRFSYNIRGQFFGHTHSDNYRVYKTHDIYNKTIGVVWMSSSMTTYSDQNPEFRIFQIDRVTKIPKNYYQYRLELNKWNNMPTVDDVTWDLTYSFLEEYGLNNMYDYSEIDQLTEKLRTDLTTYQQFHMNHNSGNAQLPQSVNNEYYCGTNSYGPNESICQSGHVRTNDIGTKLFLGIMGPWRQKISKSEQL